MSTQLLEIKDPRKVSKQMSSDNLLEVVLLLFGLANVTNNISP